MEEQNVHTTSAAYTSEPTDHFDICLQPQLMDFPLYTLCLTFNRPILGEVYFIKAKYLHALQQAICCIFKAELLGTAKYRKRHLKIIKGIFFKITNMSFLPVVLHRAVLILFWDPDGSCCCL